MHRDWLTGSAMLLGCSLAISAASAQTFSDKASGLAVTPPRARYAVTVDPQGERRADLRAEQLRQTLGAAFDVKEVTPFLHADVRGLAALGAMKLPGLAPEDQPQTFVIMMDTPKGRTTVSCAAFPEELTERRAEFEAVARGVTLPR